MLDPQELNLLDSTLLPSLERHHLRLLAHGLRTLQAAAGRRQGPVPERRPRAAWAAAQPALAGARQFAAAFLPQLQELGDQLAAIAAAAGLSPLELDLEQLRHWAQGQADQRLGTITPAPAAAAPPPG
ncbi:MAG: hypothetical protein ACK46L_15005 [Synechococcaceae cyanobacterium]